jgi:hypothetical protein
MRDSPCSDYPVSVRGGERNPPLTHGELRPMTPPCVAVRPLKSLQLARLMPSKAQSDGRRSVRDITPIGDQPNVKRLDMLLSRLLR